MEYTFCTASSALFTSKHCGFLLVFPPKLGGKCKFRVLVLKLRKGQRLLASSSVFLKTCQQVPAEIFAACVGLPESTEGQVRGRCPAALRPFSEFQFRAFLLRPHHMGEMEGKPVEDWREAREGPGRAQMPHNAVEKQRKHEVSRLCGSGPGFKLPPPTFSQLKMAARSSHFPQ